MSFSDFWLIHLDKYLVNDLGLMEDLHSAGPWTLCWRRPESVRPSEPPGLWGSLSSSLLQRWRFSPSRAGSLDLIGQRFSIKLHLSSSWFVLMFVHNHTHWTFLTGFGVASFVWNLVDGVQQRLFVAVRVQFKLRPSVIAELSYGHLKEIFTSMTRTEPGECWIKDCTRAESQDNARNKTGLKKV